jgi:hypothetical protein
LKCKEDNKCDNDCKVGGVFTCNPFATNECCVGYYCSSGTCAGCKLPNQPPENLGAAEGGPARSCCSKALKTVDGSVVCQ